MVVMTMLKKIIVMNSYRYECIYIRMESKKAPLIFSSRAKVKREQRKKKKRTFR